MEPPTAPGSAARLPQRAFVFLLLVSGFCGISYEILYARILGNLIGDQFAVTASILLTFLLGIGVGTLFAHRLWPLLWLIEAGIGVCGVFFALGGRLLDGWLYAAIPLVGRGLAASMLVSFLLLCLPAFLIGCSLPLFAGYLGRLRPGRVFARAYTVYNFGAALTALLIEFVVLRLLGLRLAVITMASLNGIVALALALRFAPLRRLRPSPQTAARFPPRHLLALALASVASAVFQLLMVKIAECLLGPFRETFALVLALILLGIAAGSWLTERYRLGFDQVVLAALAGLALLLALFPAVSWLYSLLYASAVQVYAVAVLYKLAVLALLMGLPALAFGATIPALLTVQRNVARESGQLLFVSSLANAGGFLLMAFVLHRRLDYGAIVLVAAALAALAVLVYRRTPARHPLAAGALGLAALAAWAGLWQERLLFLGHTAFQRPQALADAKRKLGALETFKGYQDVFSIAWSDGRPWFFINGYISIPLDSPAERLVGAFSSMFAPRTDRALVLGLGSGATAGAVGLLFERTDAVEINPVVLDNLFRMARWNFDIESMPGVRIIEDDGIHFVKTSEERYSLIINTVTTPLYFSSSKLYTRDFLGHVKRRMTDDGVYMTWMDARVGDRGAAIIVRTLDEVFAECWTGAISGSYFLMLCSDGKLELRHPLLAGGHPRLRRYFLDSGLPPEWIPYGLLTTRVLELADRRAPPNTLDYPALEFEMARTTTHGIPRFGERLLERMTLEDQRQALAPMSGWDPVELTLYTDKLVGPDRRIARHWHERAAAATPGFDTRLAEARFAYHETLARVSGTAEHRHGYGIALIERERYREAIAQFERVLELEPGRDGAHYNIGYSHEMLEEYEPALHAYAAELAVDPADAEALLRRGIVYLKLSRYDDALRELDAALALDDSSAELHFSRGRALMGLRRLAEAQAALREALAREPGHLRARRLLEQLDRLVG